MIEFRRAVPAGGGLPGGRRASRPRPSQPAAGTLRVYGGPESLLTLADENGLCSAGAGRCCSMTTARASRSRARWSRTRCAAGSGTSARSDASYSPTLTAAEPAGTFEAADDYTEPGWDKYQAVARYIGIKDVTASSSASDVHGHSQPSGPAAGCRSPPSTGTCAPGGNRAAGPARSASGSSWISVPRSTRARSQGGLRRQLRARPAGRRRSWCPPPPGQVADPVPVTSAAQPLPGPGRAIRLAAHHGHRPGSRPGRPIGTQVGIYDISVPGVRPAGRSVAPSVPGADPSAVVLAKDEPQPSGCMLTSLRWVCSHLTWPLRPRSSTASTTPSPSLRPNRPRCAARPSSWTRRWPTRFVRLSPRRGRG